MAYSFTAASSQRLHIASAPATGTPMTICFNTLVSTIGTYSVISIEDTTAIRRYQVGFDMTASQKRLNAQVYTGSFPQSQTAANSVEYSTRNHAVGVFASSTSRTAYLNGTAATTNTNNLTVGTVTVLTIGGSRVNGTNEYSTSEISEVGIWDVALTGAEITSLSRGFKPPRIRPQSLVFYAPLIRDLSDVRKGVTITNSNACPVAVHPRVY